MTKPRLRHYLLAIFMLAAIPLGTWGLIWASHQNFEPPLWVRIIIVVVILVPILGVMVYALATSFAEGHE